MVKKVENRVEAFVDWENIRIRLGENYVEKITVAQIMDALEKLANDIGQLRQASFYSDFTLRREEAREIESKPRFRTRHVLRSRRGKDQSDPVLISDLLEAVFTKRDYESLLLCSGDAHYCEPVRKASVKGVNIYICAVGLDVSPDLTSLAPFYPIEKYLDIDLTRKTAEAAILKDLSPKDLARWSKFVNILDSLEKNLPFVSVSYFHKDIMLSYSLGGQSRDDRIAYLETAKESEIVSIEPMDNPVRPGYTMRIIKLNRKNPLVKEILSRK